MEQLIPIIEWVKKNRFWLACGLVAVAACATWYMATTALDKDTKSQIGKIDGSKNTAEGIIKTGADGTEVSPPAHPNDSTEEGMKNQIAVASDSLMQAWKMRRDAQEPILKWPKDVIPQQRFIDIFKQFDPPEAFPGLINYSETEQGRSLDPLLDVYARNIPKRMEAICEIIGTEWEFAEKEEEEEVEEKEKKRDLAPGDDEEYEEDNGRGDRGDRSRGAQGVASDDRRNNDIVVVWQSPNQEMWNQKLTTFQGVDGQRGETGNTPTPIQVMMLQQDLWLLEAFFNVIKEVNGGADANDLAIVKDLHHIAFGREAQGKLGQLSDPDPGLAPVGSSIAGSGQSDDEGIPGEEGGRRKNIFGARKQLDPNAFNPDPGEGLAQLAPFHGRYVDANFEPIAAADIQAVLTSEEMPTDNLELLVAKRVPFRVAVTIDDQKIDDFIAACGNSPFAFETRQIRIQRPLDEIELITFAGDDVVTQGIGSNRRDKIVKGSAASGGGGGQQLGEGEGPSNSDGDVKQEVHNRTSYDVTVEFYGIVKIYNPVDSKLITRTDDDANASDPKP